jgi:hypothetical protein
MALAPPSPLNTTKNIAALRKPTDGGSWSGDKLKASCTLVTTADIQRGILCSSSSCPVCDVARSFGGALGCHALAAMCSLIVRVIWARGNARHHADLQSLASTAAQWGTHIRRRNRKCSDGAAAVLRSLGGGSTGHSVAFCVRLCDGQHFPLEQLVNGTQEELHGEAEHQLNALEKRSRSGRAGDLRPY